MAIPLPWYTSFNWIKYSKYEYVHYQCTPTSALNWCQCISNRISMHLTKKYPFTWSIDQISVSPIINHHGHYPSYCWRYVGVNLINQCTFLWDITSCICVVCIEECIGVITHIFSLSFLSTEVVQAVKIFPRWRQGLLSISSNGLSNGLVLLEYKTYQIMKTKYLYLSM